MDDVWIVGKWISEPQTQGEATWSLEGVYSSREKAIENAKPEWGWFIAPIPFDVPGPEGTEEFPETEWVEELTDA